PRRGMFVSQGPTYFPVRLILRGGPPMVSLRLRGLVFVAVLAGAPLASTAAACPFCAEQRGPTLIGDYEQASMVLFGKFTNAKLANDDDFGGGTTDFVIDKKIKDKDNTVGKKKVITLPRYVPKSNSKFLVFCDVYKGKIDPYRGVEIVGG